MAEQLSNSDINESILLAMFDVAGEGEPHEDGSHSEEIQDAIDRLAAMADRPDILRKIVEGEAAAAQ